MGYTRSDVVSIFGLFCKRLHVQNADDYKPGEAPAGSLKLDYSKARRGYTIKEVLMHRNEYSFPFGDVYRSAARMIEVISFAIQAVGMIGGDSVGRSRMDY